MQNHPSQTWPIGCRYSMKTVFFALPPLYQALRLPPPTLQRPFQLLLRLPTLVMSQHLLAFGRPRSAASVSLLASSARRIRRPNAIATLPLPMLLCWMGVDCLLPSITAHWKDILFTAMRNTLPQFCL